MKNLTLIFLLVSSLICFSQEKNKETVYLLFDEQSNEKCIVEDGSGNSSNRNKFNKEFQGEYVYFKICDEVFSAHKSKSYRDTCSIKVLDNIKTVDFEYIINKYDSLNEFKHQLFNKIFFIEKISKDKIIKYEVTWIDEIIMIED